MNDEYISAKIKEYREAHQISEMDMAQAIGTPFTFYRVFETTPSKFDHGMLEKAAEKLGVTVSELTGE
ncbi:MAG: helix-turn-helix transcriptional regulator [Eggerthellaceae bacterium]|nr:helix-turn-helix transcriptional regulator [Eggerthellaceae bacterium]